MTVKEQQAIRNVVLNKVGKTYGASSLESAMNHVIFAYERNSELPEAELAKILGDSLFNANVLQLGDHQLKEYYAMFEEGIREARA